MHTTLLRFFSLCFRGLETVLADELEAAGATDIDTVPGGAHFRGDWPVCYRVNLTSRIATRVLWRVGYSRYECEADVHRAVIDLPWPDWFEARRTLRVYVSAIRSPLRNLDYITIHIKDALCARFTRQCGKHPNKNTKTPNKHNHTNNNTQTNTLYLD